MFCVRNRKGFTLIEVMLGVAIVGLFVIAIYRFLQTDLQGITLAQQNTARETSVEALMTVMKGQLQNLSPSDTGAILGQPHVFSAQEADEMSWITAPGNGNGLFTNYYSGTYTAKITLNPNSTTKQNDLGVWRSLPDDTTPQNWLTLIANVTALEIRYYDPNLNAWVDTWSDQNNQPTMVRFRIWRQGDSNPYESVISMPLKGQVVLNLSTQDGEPTPGASRTPRPGSSATPGPVNPTGPRPNPIPGPRNPN